MKGISLSKEAIFKEKAYQVNIQKDELEEKIDSNNESSTTSK